MALELSGSINISGSMTATTIIVSAPGAPGMVSSSNQLVELNTATGSLIGITNGLTSFTASLNSKTGSYAITGSNTFIGEQTFSGSISASGMIDSNGLTFTKNNFTINTQGSISYHDVVGLTLKGKSASVFDFSYYNPQGNAVITNAVNSNDIAFNTGSVIIGMGNLKFNTAGQGIDFSATTNSSGTMTSELLNDYEEGTWSPVITDLTNDATMDGTFSVGSYTKIGRQVTVRGYVLTTSLGSVTGTIKIKGLPFANGGGFTSLGGGSVGTADGLNITAGHSVHISTPLGQSYLGVNVADSATGTTEMTAAEWSADGQLQILATYFV